jgi:hypothetical protein
MPPGKSKKMKSVWTKFSAKNQLWVHANEVNYLGDSISTIKGKIETFLKASRLVGLESNAVKTKYMIMSRHRNSGQNRNVRIANESFENVAKF